MSCSSILIYAVFFCFISCSVLSKLSSSGPVPFLKMSRTMPSWGSRTSCRWWGTFPLRFILKNGKIPSCSIGRKPDVQTANFAENTVCVHVGPSQLTMFCLCVCAGRLSESRVLWVAVGDGAGWADHSAGSHCLQEHPLRVSQSVSQSLCSRRSIPLITRPLSAWCYYRKQGQSSASWIFLKLWISIIPRTCVVYWLNSGLQGAGTAE